MAVKTLKNRPVPDQSDCIFTLPEFKNWPSLLGENKSSLSAVNDRDVSRTELVNIAAEYTHRIGLTVSQFKNADDIIVTGHQPNWHHCGIFAKNVITDRFARQTGGTAVQLVLDHDICNTSIFLPESDNNDFVRFKTIPLERKQRDIPLELRSVPSKEQLIKFIESVSKTKGSLCCEIWHQELHYIFESSVLCRNVADLITLLQTRLNAACGLEIMSLPVSLMSQSDSFVDFVCSVICNAAGFVRIYNQAIKNKRKTDNLKPDQTIRLLKTDYLNNIIELPFWLIWQTGKRASLYVSLNDKNLRIGTADSIIGTIDPSCDKKQQLIEILSKNKYVIRPKAVTLTLFARLYLADLFVHGTGSGNYEYITDHLIGDYYKISNVNFSIATATMSLPTDTENQNPEISQEILNYREFFFGLFPKGRLEKLICSQRNRI